MSSKRNNGIKFFEENKNLKEHAIILDGYDKSHYRYNPQTKKTEYINPKGKNKENQPHIMKADKDFWKKLDEQEKRENSSEYKAAKQKEYNETKAKCGFGNGDSVRYINELPGDEDMTFKVTNVNAETGRADVQEYDKKSGKLINVRAVKLNEIKTTDKYDKSHYRWNPQTKKTEYINPQGKKSNKADTSHIIASSDKMVEYTQKDSERIGWNKECLSEGRYDELVDRNNKKMSKEDAQKEADYIAKATNERRIILGEDGKQYIKPESKPMKSENRPNSEMNDIKSTINNGQKQAITDNFVKFIGHDNMDTASKFMGSVLAHLNYIHGEEKGYEMLNELKGKKEFKEVVDWARNNGNPSERDAQIKKLQKAIESVGTNFKRG